MANLKHGAYKLLRELKAGKSLDLRTNLGASLVEVEHGLQARKPFNAYQALLFKTIILPHLAFLAAHPMINDKGELMSDWKWCSTKVENSLKLLASLASEDIDTEIDRRKWLKSVSRDA
jgi:hypothetical protein